MTRRPDSAAELLRLLLRRQPVPVALVADVDPVEIARLVETALSSHAVAGMAEVLTVPRIAPGAAKTPSTDSLVAARVPAVVFVRAVVDDDPAAIVLAAHVDPLAVAMLALRALALPAYADTGAVLDRLVDVEALRLGEP